MRDVNDVIKGPVEPVGNDVHDQLDVAVEQGDGAVTQKLKERLARLVEEANDPFQKDCQGARGSGVPEGRVEDSKEDRGELLLVMSVELIGQSVMAGG